MLARRFLPPTAGPFRRRPRRLAGSLLVAMLMALLWCVSPAVAQDRAADEQQQVPPPEPITLETLDGVRLAATFYPGTKGKDSVPVILLHMWKGNRNDYSGLARLLQAEGHAVLVPDLRGHGDSTVRRGSAVPLNAANLSRNDFAAMRQFDMQTLKQLLLQKNNAGELNIEKLCLVGAEMGASVALNFARLDWNVPPVGNKKQGQDVKAVVVISPEWSTPGLPLRTAMTGPNLTTMIYDAQLKRALKDPDAINFLLPVELDFRREVSMLIVVGKGKSKDVRDAKRLQTMLKPFHPDPAPAERAQKQDLFYGTLDTSLQGTKMLGVKGLNLEQHIIRFIYLRAVQRRLPWAERKNPYG
jgi:pimeloyl-ACP methyl ester carboxylesterase